MNELNIISVNVRGLNTYERRVKIYDWLNDSKIDIAILQETHYVERNIIQIWTGPEFNMEKYVLAVPYISILNEGPVHTCYIT